MAAMEIPVYLFTGFLESGKTKFIQETMEDPRFDEGKTTLLLVCEEGLEEFEPEKFVSSKVVIREVEKEADLTPANLEAWRKECGAYRVLIEYNGMWMLEKLYQSLPEGWLVYQEFLFENAQTFLSYNANMRALVVDKLKSCELVVFNRVTPLIDKMAFHKVVRGISRRAQIAFEYTDGKVEYDEIEDPLPFDLNAPVIEIKDEDYALWYRDIAEEMKKYQGKTVRFKGQVVIHDKLPKDCFIVGRQIMTCCVEDISFSALACNYAKASELKKREWVTVTAQVNVRFHRVYGKKGPVLNVLALEHSEPPEVEVATFY